MRWLGYRWLISDTLSAIVLILGVMIEISWSSQTLEYLLYTPLLLIKHFLLSHYLATTSTTLPSGLLWYHSVIVAHKEILVSKSTSCRHWRPIALHKLTRVAPKVSSDLHTLTRQFRLPIKLLLARTQHITIIEERLIVVLLLLQHARRWLVCWSILLIDHVRWVVLWPQLLYARSWLILWLLLKILLIHQHHIVVRVTRTLPVRDALNIFQLERVTCHNAATADVMLTIRHPRNDTIRLKLDVFWLRMLHQLVLAVVAHTTGITSVRLLIGVAPFMVIPVANRCEPLCTVLTLVRLLASMNTHMD